MSSTETSRRYRQGAQEKLIHRRQPKEIHRPGVPHHPGAVREHIEGFKRDHKWGAYSFDNMLKEKHLYVRHDGNDANDGLAYTPQHAFKSAARGVAVARDWLDKGWDVKLHLQRGSHLIDTLSVPLPGSGQLTLRMME